MRFYPVAVVLRTIRHNTQNNTYKATQTLKDTLHTIITTQKLKAIPVTGRGGL
jgi:hypothetical protein